MAAATRPRRVATVRDGNGFGMRERDLKIATGGPYDQRLARRIIRPFARTGLTPNMVTGISFALGLASAFTFAYAAETLAGWAALLFMLAVLTDHMDGELARMTGKTSTIGHHLDYIVGTLNYAALFIGLGVGLSHGPWGNQALALGLAVGLANPVICGLRMLMDSRYGVEAVEHPAAGGFEIEDFIYLIGPIAWMGWIGYFFLVYGLGTFGYLIFTIASLLRQEYLRHKLRRSGH
jgi:phosphatidylglycerophosphate synthase